jgi:predicted O-methyltransferase YrrM
MQKLLPKRAQVKSAFNNARAKVRLRTRIREIMPIVREAISVRRGTIEPCQIIQIGGFLLAEDKQVLSNHVRLLPRKSIIVEIGSFLGLSATIMSASRRDCRIICIDPCDLSGEEDSLACYQRLGFRGAAQYCMLWLNLTLYGARARIIKATSQSALKKLHTKFNLLFIDGDHSYEACARDVQSYSPYLQLGGTLILHDAIEGGWPGPIKLARELSDSDNWRLLEERGNCAVFRKLGS